MFLSPAPKIPNFYLSTVIWGFQEVLSSKRLFELS